LDVLLEIKFLLIIRCLAKKKKKKIEKNEI